MVSFGPDVNQFLPPSDVQIGMVDNVINMGKYQRCRSE